jgi:hypothetical protein
MLLSLQLRMRWLRDHSKLLSLKHRLVLLPQVRLSRLSRLPCLLRLLPTGVPPSLRLPSVVVSLRLLRLLRLLLPWLLWRFLRLPLRLPLL